LLLFQLLRAPVGSRLVQTDFVGLTLTLVSADRDLNTAAAAEAETLSPRWQKLPHMVQWCQEGSTMTTMNISLPDEMKAFIEAEMATEGFASASEYLRTLIREAQKRRARQALEEKFREALESGPATPMTKDDWVALRREALEGLAGEKIRP
jgi:antitoxin ParD1/3/4